MRKDFLVYYTQMWSTQSYVQFSVHLTPLSSPIVFTLTYINIELSENQYIKY